MKKNKKCVQQLKQAIEVLEKSIEIKISEFDDYINLVTDITFQKNIILEKRLFLERKK